MSSFARVHVQTPHLYLPGPLPPTSPWHPVLPTTRATGKVRFSVGVDRVPGGFWSRILNRLVGDDTLVFVAGVRSRPFLQ